MCSSFIWNQTKTIQDVDTEGYCLSFTSDDVAFDSLVLQYEAVVSSSCKLINVGKPNNMFHVHYLDNLWNLISCFPVIRSTVVIVYCMGTGTAVWNRRRRAVVFSSTHKIVGCVTLSRKDHTCAQTRELPCTKLVLPSKGNQLK